MKNHPGMDNGGDVSQGLVCVSVHLGCYHKIPQTGLIKNRNLVLVVLEVRVHDQGAGLVSGEGFLGQRRLFLRPYMVGQMGELSGTPYVEHEYLSLGSTLMT